MAMVLHDLAVSNVVSETLLVVTLKIMLSVLSWMSLTVPSFL